MKKALGAAALLAVGALTLTSCSSGGATVGADATIDPDEQITLQVMSTTLAAEPEASAEKAIGAAFMAEHPNVTIEYIPVAYNDYGTKLTTVATSREVPDVFVNGPELAPRIADLGIAQDVTALLGEDFVAGFDPTTAELSQFDGTLAYAPYYTAPMALIYRTDLFEAAGLQPPTTWEEFRAAAQALTTDTDSDGSVDQWGFAMVGTANASGGSRFAPVLRSLGAVELQQEGEGWSTEVGTPAGEEAFQLYADLVADGVVPPGALNTGYPDAVNLMASGQTAMIISGSHAIGSIAAAGGEALVDSLAAVPVPAGPGGHQSSLGQLGFSVSADTEHPEAAAEYIEFFLSAENQVAFTTATGRLPTRTDALEAPELDGPRYAGFIDAIQYAFETPPAPFYLNVQTITAEGYQQAINGTPAAEVATSTAARVEREIANNG